MKIRLIAPVLSIIIVSSVICMPPTREEVSTDEMITTLLAADNFDRFFAQDTYCGFMGKFPSQEALCAYEKNITSMPNIVSQYIDNERVSCFVKARDNSYTARGMKNGRFTVYATGSNIPLCNEMPQCLQNIPVTAFAHGTGTWNLTDKEKPVCSLVIGYQNGKIVFYKSLRKIQYITQIDVPNPILHITRGALHNTWLFATHNCLYIYTYNKENFKAQKVRPIRTIDIPLLGDVHGMGTDGCTLVFKKKADNYYAIRPYSVQEVQQLFVDQNPEILKQYYTAYQTKKQKEITQLQHNVASLELEAVKTQDSDIISHE